MTAILDAAPAPAAAHEQAGLKDYLVFRVDELDGHRELTDDSALEAEAVRYADLVAGAEPESGIYYEVRAADTGALLHTTDACAPSTERKGEAWLQTAML